MFTTCPFQWWDAVQDEVGLAEGSKSQWSFMRFLLVLHLTYVLRGDGWEISEAVKPGRCEQVSVPDSCYSKNPCAELLYPNSSCGTSHLTRQSAWPRGHSLSQPDHVRVASALCPFGGDCVLICTILNPVWAGSSHSPYRRVGCFGYHLVHTRKLLTCITFLHRFIPQLLHFLFLSEN